MSYRYNKITVWKKELIKREFKERPFNDFLLFQNCISFLKTNKSNTECIKEMAKVRASIYGFMFIRVSRIMSISLSDIPT